MNEIVCSSCTRNIESLKEVNYQVWRITVKNFNCKENIATQWRQQQHRFLQCINVPYIPHLHLDLWHQTVKIFPWDLQRVYEIFIFLFVIANLWGRTMCGLALESNLNIYKPTSVALCSVEPSAVSWNSPRCWAENICTRGKGKSKQSGKKEKIKQSRPLCCIQRHVLQTPFERRLPSQQSLFKWTFTILVWHVSLGRSQTQSELLLFKPRQLKKQGTARVSRLNQAAKCDLEE